MGDDYDDIEPAESSIKRREISDSDKKIVNSFKAFFMDQGVWGSKESHYHIPEETLETMLKKSEEAAE